MPLMQGKSKHAFEHNLKAELSAGKPKDQSLAIAYNVKRKNAKKMAAGGIVSAKAEKRPMPDQETNDAKMARQSDHMKPQTISAATEARPMPKKGMHTTPIKHPKMVKSDIVQARLRDEEDHLESSAAPASDKEQPPKADDEMDAKRQGPKVRPMKRMAEGGEVDDGKHRHDNERGVNKTSYDLPEGMSRAGEMARFGNMNAENKHKQTLNELKNMSSPKLKGLAKGGMINEDVSMHDAEEDMVDHPADLESDDDQMSPSEDEIMSSTMNGYASGGSVDEEDSLAPVQKIARPDAGWGAIISKAEGGMIDIDDETVDHAASIAAAIMAKRDRMKMMAEGGEVDLNENSMEQPNEYYDRNEHAALKENYDSDMEHMHQPMDSNEHGDDREEHSENDYDMTLVDAIRRKMAKNSPITR